MWTVFALLASPGTVGDEAVPLKSPVKRMMPFVLLVASPNGGVNDMLSP